MRTILIAERDPEFADQLARLLRTDGHHVIVCPGPQPPARCIRCDKGYCPLTEGADLMIYDPSLTAPDPRGESYNLAIDSARAHPEVPMLLTWPPTDPPDIGTLRAIRYEVPSAAVAADESSALLRQVRDMLASGGSVAPSD